MKKVAVALALVSVVALLATAVSAYGGVDTTGDPEVWAILNLQDPDDISYTLWLKGWRERYFPASPEPDGTISHQVFDVLGDSPSLLPKVAGGDNVLCVHGWYEDGSYKWICNAKDFNLHLETFLGNWTCCVTTGPHGGWLADIAGKSYGMRLSGTVEWGVKPSGSPPFKWW